MTLDAALEVAHRTSEEEISGFESYGAEVAAYVEMGHNLYLLPALAVSRTTSFDLEEGGEELEVDPVTTYAASLALYYLY